jgi:hypothetical protein
MYVVCSETTLEERRTTLAVATQPRDLTAENILKRLSDLENHPEEEIVPYQEVNVEGKLYYFTPGGFLYRKERGTEEVGGFFCGYLSSEVWRRRVPSVNKRTSRREGSLARGPHAT